MSPRITLQLFCYLVPFPHIILHRSLKLCLKTIRYQECWMYSDYFTSIPIDNSPRKTWTLLQQKIFWVFFFFFSFNWNMQKSSTNLVLSRAHQISDKLFVARKKSVQFSSVAQLCPTLCDPVNHSTPGLPVHHQLQEFTPTHVHWVSDAIQPSHPLSSPSPPAPNPSQHQGLFQWVNSSHEVAKVLEFQLQHQSFQWTPRTDLI